MDYDFLLLKLKSIFGPANMNWELFGWNVLTMLLALVIEAFYTGWENSSIRHLISKPDQSAKNDIWSWLISVSNLFKFISIVLSLGIGYWFFGFIIKKFNLQSLQLIEYPLLQFFAATAAYDLVNYTKHRLSHYFNWYWELHKFHHSATEMNVLTAHRTHFLEETFDSIIRALPFAILGAPVESFLWFYLLKEIQQNLHHSKVHWTWGWVGRWIFVSPAGHRLHHSKNPKHFGKNFASIFVIWDKLFGTYHAPEIITEFGVDDDYYNLGSFPINIWMGCKMFWLRIIGK